MSCDRSCPEEIKDHYKCKDEPLYIFKYNGPKACPIEMPDYITFFSKNIVFLAVLFLTSVVGMVLGKDKERLVMALTSVQAAIMIASAAGIWVDIHYKIDKQLAELYFGIIAIIWSVLVFGASYFSRPISMFFVCGALSYSIVWTICYLITVSLEVSIHWLIYLLSTVVSFVLISTASTFNPQLREKYSFVIYTSITNPFFLCMSIAVYLKLYVDVITYSQYKEWRREDQIRPYAWVFVPV